MGIAGYSRHRNHYRRRYRLITIFAIVVVNIVVVTDVNIVVVVIVTAVVVIVILSSASTGTKRETERKESRESGEEIYEATSYDLRCLTFQCTPQRLNIIEIGTLELGPKGSAE